MAIAPAPWTYPSHSSFFTGQWPYQLNTQWNSRLDATYPTLAEYLASRGYQTAGFVANTRCCSYETGLDRGFAHYDDYPLTPRFLLGRTVPGSWILMNFFSPGDFYEAKWINFQSRDARGINDAFLDWLKGRQRDRPFFAFLNYYDAHNPYIPPPKYAGHFGIQPRYPEDYVLLFDFRMDENDPNWDRNMAHGAGLLRRLHRRPRRPARAAVERAPPPAAPGQHAGDHHRRPRRIVRRSLPLQPRHRPLHRPDRRAARDPVSGRTRGPHRDHSRQPARPAGHGGRPAGPLGRLTVPGPLAGGVLEVDAPDRRLRRSPQPSRSSSAMRTHSRIATTQGARGSRCP